MPTKPRFVHNLLKNTTSSKAMEDDSDSDEDFVNDPDTDNIHPINNIYNERLNECLGMLESSTQENKLSTDNVTFATPLEIGVIEHQKRECNEKFPIMTDIQRSLYIQDILNTLRIGEKAAILLPNGQSLFSIKKVEDIKASSGKKNANDLILIRQLFMGMCDIIEIMSLPDRAFRKHVNNKTVLIYFIKRREWKDILSFESDYHSKKEKRTYHFSEIRNDYDVLFSFYRPSSKEKKIYCTVKHSTIKNNDFSWNYSDYTDLNLDVIPSMEENNYKKLGDICEFNPENTKKKNQSMEMKYLRIGNVVNGEIVKFTDKIEDSRNGNRLLRIGDTLMSSIRPNKCKNTLIKEYFANAIASKSFICLRPKTNLIIPEYLYYMMTEDSRIQYYLHQKAVSNGASVPQINIYDLKELQIKVPSLDDQRKFLYDKSIVRAYAF